MMYFDTLSAFLVVCLCAQASGAGWSWPEGAESVRIDTKVRFIDDTPPDKGKRSEVHTDDLPFREPTETEGFYNRPPGAGRYPVRVRVEASRAAYRVDGQGVYPVNTDKGNDGTIDSLQFCKCVSTPECNPRHDSAEVCGAGKYLCCYKRPNKLKQHNTEFFNEIDDERPMLFPGKEKVGGPFPPPPGHQFSGVFGPGHGHDTAVLGAVDETREAEPDELFTDIRKPLSGPSRPPAVLSGPGGPTGIIGPAPVNTDNSASAQRNVLVGPGGPTGVIGPFNRPVLVGPDGPTGVIGPIRGGSRGVLVGPGGPTGIIGPAFSRQQRPGLLVGPGGPTGIIGPGRQLLVGPGGPTGHIGPNRYFDDEIHEKNCCGPLAMLGQRAFLSIPMWTQTGHFGPIASLQNALRANIATQSKTTTGNQCSRAANAAAITTTTTTPTSTQSSTVRTTTSVVTPPPSADVDCLHTVKAPLRTTNSVVHPHHSIGSTDHPLLVTPPKRQPIAAASSNPTLPPVTRVQHYPDVPVSAVTISTTAPCIKTSPHPTPPMSPPTSPPHSHEHHPINHESHIHSPSVYQHEHVPHVRSHPIEHIPRKRRSFFNGCGSCTGEKPKPSPRKHRKRVPKPTRQPTTEYIPEITTQGKNTRARGAFFGGCGRACSRSGTESVERDDRKFNNKPTPPYDNSIQKASARRGAFFRGFHGNPNTRRSENQRNSRPSNGQSRRQGISDPRGYADDNYDEEAHYGIGRAQPAKKKKRVVTTTTPPTTTTIKPSIFRGVGNFTAFLKLGQMAIMFGLI